MPEWLNEALEVAKPYWPFVAQIVVIWYLGQIFKKRVWTRERAARGEPWKLLRDTLPFHPVVAGGIWGALYPWLPAVEFVTTRGGAITEGVLAGTVSVAAFVGLEYWAEKRKIGWLLKLLRDSVERSSETPNAG